MEKLKVKSINHKENIFWLSFALNDASAELIDGMVRAFDKGYPWKEGILLEGINISSSRQIIGTKIALQRDLSRPDDHGIYGILFADKKVVDLILLKDHPLFKKLISYLQKRVAL